MKICVMQPYFIPYPGYYLLYKYTDIFVILMMLNLIREVMFIETS